MYKLPERRGGGGAGGAGGRGNLGNARKKTFFFSGGVPLHYYVGWMDGTGSLNHLPTRAPLESAVLISVDSRPTHENPIKPPPH